MVKKLQEMFPCGIPGKTGFQAGIEYEIEAIQDWDDVPAWALHRIEKDGSLRNNGREFITNPLNYEQHLKFFKELHSTIKLDFKKEPFSERTSIHVHVNCGDLSEEQTKALILCYALLEPVFFDFAGNARKHNIHCVPLSFTSLPGKYKKDLVSLIGAWSKYTAFNIVPLGNQCTIEFRHLGGTNDYDRFVKWLDLIKTLYDFIDKNKEFNLGKFLAEGNEARELYQLIYQKPFNFDPGLFIQSTIDVKESFV